MAELFAALDDESDGAPVVVKRILPHLAQNPEFLGYFVDEVALASQLRHPNIVRTIAAGRDDQGWFIAMEHLVGATAIELLRSACHQQLALPIGACVRVAVDAAYGLAHAHSACDETGRPLGLVHRDITPHNLFICADGTTKVLDFGIAKQARQRTQTLRGTIKGKPSYLAPEQARAQTIDARVDLFALGIVLHELIARRPLFRGSNDEETMANVLSRKVPPLVRLRPDCPEAVARVVARALERDPTRRQPSAAVLALELEAAARESGLDATRAHVGATLLALCPNEARRHELVSQTAVTAVAHGKASQHTPPAELLVGAVATATMAAQRSPARMLRGAFVACAAIAAALLLQPTVPAGKEVPPPPAPLLSQMKAAATAAPARPLPALVLRSTPPVAAPGEAGMAPSPHQALLRLQAPAGCAVTIDGVIAPRASGAFHLAPGRHRVVVAGGPLLRPRVLAVKLREGEVLERQVAPERGRLHVVIEPPSDLTIDGQARGRTTLATVELDEGPHVLELRNVELGRAVWRRVVIAPHRDHMLRLSLKR